MERSVLPGGACQAQPTRLLLRPVVTQTRPVHESTCDKYLRTRLKWHLMISVATSLRPALFITTLRLRPRQLKIARGGRREGSSATSTPKPGRPRTPPAGRSPLPVPQLPEGRCMLGLRGSLPRYIFSNQNLQVKIFLLFERSRCEKTAYWLVPSISPSGC